MVLRVDLEAAHEAVRDAARRGIPAVFGPDDDEAVEHHDGADELAPYDDEAAWAARTVDGGWLATFLSESGDELHGHGLTIVGARILGGLDLEGVTLTRRFGLIACQLGEHRVFLRDARTRTVQLDSIRCGGIRAERVHVAGSLLLDEIDVRGFVRMVDARVDASVMAKGAHIEPPPAATIVDASAEARGSGEEVTGRVALNADRARIEGSVLLHDGFTAVGSVRLFGATIGGDLFLRGATIRNPGGNAFRASGAEVGGSVILDRGFEATGENQMFGIKVRRDISCKHAILENPGADALSLDGAEIGGGMLLQESQVRGQIRLGTCHINGDLRCGGAQIEGSAEAALRASRATIGGNVFLDLGFSATGRVRIPGVSIGRSLFLGSATLTNPDGPALEADGARIGAGVQLNHGFSAVGEVRLVGATIGAGLDCGGASLDRGNLDTPALDARRIRIAGSALLERGFTARGRVRFVGATVDGDLNLRGARIVNPEGVSLHLTGAQVGGTVFLTDEFVAEGEVRMLGIDVRGDVFAQDATITSAAARAISMTRARVTGDVVFTRGVTAEGRIRIARAAVSGNLDCTGGTFRNPGSDAIDASHTQVTRGIVLSGTTTVEGRFNLEGVQVAGSLDLGQARIAHTTGGYAVEAGNARVAGAVYIRGHVVGGVDLRGINVGGDIACSTGHVETADDDQPAVRGDRAQVTGGLLFNRGFHADGEVRFRGASVNGHASFVSACIANPGGVALNLGGSQITGTVVLSDGFCAEGETRLTATSVRGNVGCEGGRFVSPDGEAALNAAGLHVGGTLFLHDGFRAEGTVVLRGATVGILQDEAAAWPEQLDLDGFTYERLTCPRRDRGWRARRQWLRRQLTPSAEGYVQLANVYRSAGDELDARRILIERHNALLRPPEHWRDQLPRGPLELLRRAWRWLLRLTIGHGFAPGRALLIAVPIVVALALWLTYARGHDMLVPTDETAVTVASGEVPRSSDCQADYPCVQPVVYALDTLVPGPFELGQNAHWQPDQSARGTTFWDDGRFLAAATWTATILGGVLVALVVAGFTQMVRRE